MLWPCVRPSVFPSQVGVLLNVSVSDNSRFIQRIIAKPLMRCVRWKNEKISVQVPSKTVNGIDVTDLAGGLVTSIPGRRASHRKNPTTDLRLNVGSC